MTLTECSKRTAQLAIAEACRQGSIVQADGQYRLPAVAALGCIDVRTGSRPGGCPRPMRRSWLRRNRLTRNPPAVHCIRAWEGFLVSASAQSS